MLSQWQGFRPTALFLSKKINALNRPEAGICGICAQHTSYMLYHWRDIDVEEIYLTAVTMRPDKYFSRENNALISLFLP